MPPRTRQHEVETESRRIVAFRLPADRFVEREAAERDYGIDMTIECFHGGEPSGAHLLLQIKGANSTGPANAAGPIDFDIEVKSPLRAERFVTDFRGHKVRVLRIETLAALKHDSTYAKDRQSLALLEAAIEQKRRSRR
jgi:hypothetical protein